MKQETYELFLYLSAALCENTQHKGIGFIIGVEEEVAARSCWKFALLFFPILHAMPGVRRGSYGCCYCGCLKVRGSTYELHRMRFPAG